MDADRLPVDQEIEQLTTGYNHSERRLTRVNGKERAVRHLTTWPSLLDQLRRIAAELRGQADDAARRVPESCPPGDWAAVSALAMIEQAAGGWITTRLGMPTRANVEGNLRYLLSLAAVPRWADQVCGDIHRWWIWASIETGWQSPARTLTDPCPYCSARAIRVRGDVTCAWCSDCGAAWDRATIGVLGQMLTQARAVREAHAADRRAAERASRQAAAQVNHQATG